LGEGGDLAESVKRDAEPRVLWSVGNAVEDEIVGLSVSRHEHLLKTGDDVRITLADPLVPNPCAECTSTKPISADCTSSKHAESAMRPRRGIDVNAALHEPLVKHAADGAN
jgi:hypothetical protein